MSAPLVEMAGIEKRFPGVHALRAASFELRAGEVHALMGENGAGKSTLMKCLAGIERPDAGEIRLDGAPVSLAGPRGAQAAGIGIIHQELSLMDDLTAAQNIFIGREPRGRLGLLDERALNARAAALFASMRLDLGPRARVSELTIARQQMVEIAKALSHRSRVLIMDEPTAALNDAEIEELFATIRRLRSEGVGIVYISHRMDELARIADRVTVMRDGATVGTLGSDAPLSRVIAMMVGREVEPGRPEIPPAPEGPPLLEVRGLARGREIRDVSFDLHAGEILGFAGLMGAGRTEVARAVFGADRVEAGEVRLNGRTLRLRAPSDAVAAGIGYLSEDRKRFGLATGMDLRANVGMASLARFVSRLGLVDEGALGVAARGYVASLAIRTPSDRQEVRLLSGGNQQKVVLAKWLLRDCAVLIFDEPTRGIDVGAKSEIHALLRALAAEGRGVIVISSELPEVLALAHRVAVMCEGRLTGILPGGASQEAVMALATRRDEGRAA